MTQPNETMIFGNIMGLIDSLKYHKIMPMSPNDEAEREICGTYFNLFVEKFKEVFGEQWSHNDKKLYMGGAIETGVTFYYQDGTPCP